MDYSKLHWVTDYLSYEVYGEGVDDYVVGVYQLKDFPEITFHINTELSQIIEVFVDSEYYNDCD